ncbi:ATP-binding protein [Selenihalanaerobacter shriftii]|uniref:histidine kinase n=1 Tax=Selenihalanaerobacter shriftii TaxID=142842 RepID=A0A1T4Q9A0_9FIRM|nr:ATP-binding protein [Selenihalanaerobacter shriftii]SKA00284.1 PAS domain S-box-containing protein [Selenihalanaerobacter shriftii]
MLRVHKLIIGITNSVKSKLIIIIFIIIVFTVSIINLFILPSIKQEIYQEKKIQMKRIVDSSVGILQHYYELAQKGKISQEEAQYNAKHIIKESTYGPKKKKYLWILNFDSQIIIHPFKPKLNGNKLNDLIKITDIPLKFMDINNKSKTFFLTDESQATSVANELDESFQQIMVTLKEQVYAYMDYKWQYYDDQTKVEPKMAYVTAFKPWKWILGTGIYVNEVEQRVKEIRNRIILILFCIMTLIGIVVYFLTDHFLSPIITASNFASNIAKGNFDIELPQCKTDDEIGNLLTSLDKMQEQLYSHINQLNETNKELKHEKNKLQKYLNVSQIIFLIINKDKEVELINQKGCEILGYNREEIIGKKWIDNFVSEKEKGELKKECKKVMSQKSKVIDYYENKIINKDGEEIIMAWHNTSLYNEQGEFQGVLSSGIDITERKLLKEELEYNQLQAEFFANLSHELKTPLNLIFSALQMLNLYRKNNLNSNNNKSCGKYIDVINQNGYRLLRLVNNLVDITKIDSNSFTLNLQNCDIVNLIKDITYSVEDYIKHKDCILEFNSNISEVITACDPFNIERIMLNLLSNAIKFTDVGDQISVNMYKDDEDIFVSVKDTGIGIPKDKQKIIFKRFGQADKSFTRNSEGSGIGLAIVELLVKMHNGEITVNSEYQKGSEFIIKLPINVIEEDKKISSNNYFHSAEELIDRIDVEFSDIYDL